MFYRKVDDSAEGEDEGAAREGAAEDRLCLCIEFSKLMVCLL